MLKSWLDNGWMRYISKILQNLELLNGTKYNCKHWNRVQLLVYFTLNLTITFISEVCTKKMSGIATTSQPSKGWKVQFSWWMRYQICILYCTPWKMGVQVTLAIINKAWVIFKVSEWNWPPDVLPLFRSC